MEEEDEQEISRRGFLAWMAAAAALVALPGCDGQPYADARPTRPRHRSPGVAYASVRQGGPGTADFIAVPREQPIIGVPSTGTYITANASYTPEPIRTVQASYTVPVQPAYTVQRPVAPKRPRIVASGGKVQAIGRNTWGATPATASKMKAMGGVTRITVHHEGSAKPNNDTSPAQVAETLRLIQSQHRKRMGAGDIGYHFIIDRTGTIWQGRDWQYQGAHTSGANANNIGVMLLGNFEIQQPTAAQLSALHSLTASLVRKYGLKAATDIYGHSDFCNTQCPGKHLKPQVKIMRAGLR